MSVPMRQQWCRQLCAAERFCLAFQRLPVVAVLRDRLWTSGTASITTARPICNGMWKMARFSTPARSRRKMPLCGRLSMGFASLPTVGGVSPSHLVAHPGGSGVAVRVEPECAGTQFRSGNPTRFTASRTHSFASSKQLSDALIPLGRMRWPDRVADHCRISPVPNRRWSNAYGCPLALLCIESILLGGEKN